MRGADQPPETTRRIPLLITEVLEALPRRPKPDQVPGAGSNPSVLASRRRCGGRSGPYGTTANSARSSGVMVTTAPGRALCEVCMRYQVSQTFPGWQGAVAQQQAHHQVAPESLATSAIPETERDERCRPGATRSINSSQFRRCPWRHLP